MGFWDPAPPKKSTLDKSYGHVNKAWTLASNSVFVVAYSNCNLEGTDLFIGGLEVRGSCTQAPELRPAPTKP